MGPADNSSCALGQKEVEGSSARPQPLEQEPGATRATFTPECEHRLATHCAPRDSRRSMAGSCPQAQASDRGVWPCVSCWDTLAPAAANRLMTSR